MEQKNVVVVGGGNGAAVSILALKRHLEQFAIAAVISMSDSGGSSGRLRKEFNTLPPGDILRGMLAMSRYDYATLRQIFYESRFEGAGKMDKHNLGNLFLTLGGQYTGDLVKTFSAFHQALECVGSVFPVTLDENDLCAEFMGGEVVCGEEAIDRPDKKHFGTMIKRVWLDPEPKLFGPAKTALLEADYIIIGPGSLYTSLVPNLLVQGFGEAVQASKAKIVYVLGNGYELHGENGPTTMSGFVQAIQKYLLRKIDLVIYNTEDLGVKEKKFYADKKWGVATRDIEEIQREYHLLGHKFEREGGGLSKEKLSEAFKQYLV